MLGYFYKNLAFIELKPYFYIQHTRENSLLFSYSFEFTFKFLYLNYCCLVFLYSYTIHIR